MIKIYPIRVLSKVYAPWLLIDKKDIKAVVYDKAINTLIHTNDQIAYYQYVYTKIKMQSLNN